MSRTTSAAIADLNDFSVFETLKSAMSSGGMHRGIRLRTRYNQLVIDLHIVTGIGANLNAITDSIKNKVRYAVEQATGIQPAAINVYIDGIRA